MSEAVEKALADLNRERQNPSRYREDYAVHILETLEEAVKLRTIDEYPERHKP